MKADPRSALRRLYRGVDGFEIPAKDERRVERSRGSSLYGELMPTATLRLLELLELGPGDHFVDLGAGLGKVVLFAAMHTEAGSVLGVELSPTRAALAEQTLARARSQGLAGVERVSIVEGDMMRVPLARATVIYTCSTAFSEAFMSRLGRRLAKLPKLRTIATLQDFERPPRGFELSAIHRLDATWKRRTRVHIYERKPG